MGLSLDEYRIAQLYMIQKKSKQESTGEGIRYFIYFCTISINIV